MSSLEQHAITLADGTHRTEQLLADAVAEAVGIGLNELTRLDGIVADAESRLGNVREELNSRGRIDSKKEDGFLRVLEEVVGDLGDRLVESRRAARTFNIAFFGRTGTGKSTLLSALGGLNGDLVSDGRSDFTTEVQSLDWHGCRLYDTPGINGWGRTRPQPDLEEAAREAVEVADVVLLCFDSQSQQASEFRKVADWVRAYRKPVIAVLNVRNPMWRHPSRVPSPAQRSGLARMVQQHSDNITTELEAIALPDVPVVAINSQRALFARASTPFTGPGAIDLEANHSAYGLDYLNRWSNLPVLEELIAACIVEGAADLRLATLREGLQACLREWAGEVERVAGEQQARGAAIERVVAEWLSVLGYPNDAWRSDLTGTRDGADLLTLLEAARREPFTASVSGRLEGHARHLLRSHLYPHRVKSLHAAEDLILNAFESKKRVWDAEFDRRVFDIAPLAKTVATVARQAGEFVADNLHLAGVNASIDVNLINRARSEVLGNTGINRRRVANVLKATGLLSGTASAILGVIALTNFWNPAGWSAAAIFAGLGILSAVLNAFGKRTRKRAEEKRVGARASAVAEGRAVVNAFFDKCETDQLARILVTSRSRAGGRLAELLSDALHTRWGSQILIEEAAWLRAQADSQTPTKSPAEVIQRAVERVHTLSDARRPSTASSLLLGEDWVGNTDDASDAADLSQVDRERLERAGKAARAEFAAYLTGRFRAERIPLIRQWLGSAYSSEFLDEQTQAGIAAAQSLLDSPPRVVVVGDYSSGKTSLVKRLLAEAETETATGLRVEASPVTSALRHYRFGPLDLVDVPGFQSGRDSHDAAAAEAAQDAALVIVVLHVNLLIGDTSALERLLVGDEASIGSASRTIFVIGRIDEVGVDPHFAARDFLVRRHRKIEELLTIFRSKSIVVRPQQVLAVAADPYGLVGDRSPVTQADYAPAARVWDGVAALCEPLLSLDGERLLSLAAEAALDRARSALRLAKHRVECEIDDLDEAQSARARLERLVEISLAELRLLTRSIKGRTRRVAEDHASEVLAEALGAGPDAVDVMAKRLDTWWEDPRLGSAMDSLSVEIERELDEWSRRHASEFDRELKRFEFAAETKRSGKDQGGGLAGGVHAAAVGVKHVGVVVKAIGNRDAVYAIGKALGAKFKPWGAVKLGAKVGKAGAILGVVSVGFDIMDWAMDAKKEARRELARQTAAEHIRATTDDVVAGLLDQEEGPMNYVREVDALFAGHLQQLVDQGLRQQQSMVDAAHRRDGMMELHAAGESLAEVPTERAAR